MEATPWRFESSLRHKNRIIGLMKFLKSKLFLKTTLVLSFIIFTTSSWWLLFRDERALSAIESFYPFLDGGLLQIRQVLLKYGLNVVPTIAFAVTGIWAFIAYFAALKVKFSKKSSILLAVIFQTIVFFSYPVLSTDIFSYVFSHRVFTEYGQNTWKVAPDRFSSDPFEQLADWKENTSVYGAVNQITYLPATVFGGDDLIATIFLYKLTAAVFVAGTIWLVLKITEEKSDHEQAQIVRMFFWNPLFVLEFLGSAHNDIIMFFFLLAAIYYWQKKHWFFSGVFLALAVQVKIIPIIVFGFLALWLLQKKQLKNLVKFAASFLTVNLAAFAYMNINPLEFLQRVAFNNSVYWQSVPALFERLAPATNIPFALVFAIFGLFMIIWQIKKNRPPLETASITLLVYVAFFTSAYWNWYIFWAMIPAVFTKNKQLIALTVLLTFGSLMAYPILWLSHRFFFGHPFWQIFTYAGIFILPIVFWWFNKEKLENLMITREIKAET